VGEKKPTYVFCDNQNAIGLCHNPKYHSRSKHFLSQTSFCKKTCGTKGPANHILWDRKYESKCVNKKLGENQILTFQK